MQKVVRLVFAAVIISLVCWIASRWNVWFNKHPEPQFQLTESVCGVQLTVGDNPLTERIVSWRSRPDSALLKDNAVRMGTQSPIYSSANNVLGQVHATIQFPQNISWRNEFGIDYTSSQDQRFSPAKPSSKDQLANDQQFYLRNNMYWRFASTLKVFLPARNCGI